LRTAESRSQSSSRNKKEKMKGRRSAGRENKGEVLKLREGRVTPSLKIDKALNKRGC
jgi:hypothetical protein